MAMLLAPPVTFGPPWKAVGEHRLYGVPRELWHLDGDPAPFAVAYKAVRGPLIAAGFTWTERGTERGTLVPCWWRGVDEDNVNIPELQAAVDEAIAGAAARRAEADAKREAARLAEIARVAEISTPIRSRLQQIVGSSQWQLGRQLSEASELAHQSEWNQHDLDRATQWITNADGNRSRAEERIAAKRPIIWYERAADPDVRAAAHEGLRILAGRDKDWASIDNGIGFSQVTCWAGHALAERDCLDQGEAAHGLLLLFQHRGQLPGEIVLRALGIEPKPTRRRPSPGALLASA